VVVACAVSAGIHAALVGEHWEFAPASLALVGIAAALARTDATFPLDAATVALGGLIAAYAAAATVGIPLVHPEPEPVDGLGLATKAIEAAGLLAALHLKGTFSWRTRTPIARFPSR
jgi:hypothetical protein